MIERGFDFDKEFKKMSAIDAAAGDRDLRYFYWDRIHTGLSALPEAHDLIADEVSHFHNLTAEQYQQALVMCLAGLIEGVQTGRERFSYDG